MTNGRALVFDAERRQALVAIRSLGHRGIDVTAASDLRMNAGAASKYVDRRIRYPPPQDDPKAFINRIESEIRHQEYDVLFPIANPTVIPIVDARDRLEPYATIPFPNTDTLHIGMDKKRTIEAAREAGVPHPKTLSPDRLDLDAVAAELGYPVVLKPRQGAGRVGVSVCDTPAELEAAYADTDDRHRPLLIQEFIPDGGERGVYTLYDWSSELKAVTVQQRIRANPPEGGTSTLRKTVQDPDLISLTDDLLSTLGWQGVAMAEFRLDPRDGMPKLMEINPRFWGSLALSVGAGVDFPHLLYQLATTGECETALDYKVGVQARHLLGDIAHLLAREDKVPALQEFLRPADQPRSYDVLSTDDSLASVMYFAAEVGKFVQRRLPS